LKYPGKGNFIKNGNSAQLKASSINMVKQKSFACGKLYASPHITGWPNMDYILNSFF